MFIAGIGYAEDTETVSVEELRNEKNRLQAQTVLLVGRVGELEKQSAALKVELIQVTVDKDWQIESLNAEYGNM